MKGPQRLTLGEGLHSDYQNPPCPLTFLPAGFFLAL